MNKDIIGFPARVGNNTEKEHIEKNADDTVAVMVPDGTIKEERPRPLNEIEQRIVWEYFEKKGFTILEISDVQVKVISCNGKGMTVPNRVALDVATKI